MSVKHLYNTKKGLSFKKKIVLFTSILFLTLFFSLPLNRSTFQSNSWLYFTFFLLLNSFFSCVFLINFRRVSIKITYTDLLLSFFTFWILSQFLFLKKITFYHAQWFFLFSIYIIFRLAFQIFYRKEKLDLILVIFFILFIIALLETSLGFFQLYDIYPNNNPNFKITGNFINPDHFTGFIGSFATLGIALYSFKSKVTIKFISNLGLLNFLLALVLIPATTSRSSLLGLLISITYLAYHRYNLRKYMQTKFHTRKSKVVFILTAIGIGFVSSTLIYHLKPDSAFGRLFIWKTTTNLILEKPLLGHGLEQFKILYNKEQAAYFASGFASDKEKMIAGNVDHAHNEFLHMWAELGLIGLLLFIGLLSSIFCYPSKKQRGLDKLKTNETILVCIKASLIYILIFSFFSFPLHIFSTLAVFFILLALGTALNDNSSGIVITSRLPKLIFLISILSFFLAFGGYSLKQYKLNKEWEKAKELLHFQLYEEAIFHFENLYPTFNKNGEYLFYYGGLLSTLEEFDKATLMLERAKSFYSDPNLFMLLADTYEKNKNYDKALLYYKYSWNIIPHKIYPLYRMVLVYKEIGNTKKAINIATKIVGMKDKVETAASLQIKEEMNDFIKGKN